MALRASLGVFFSCQFGTASKLLAAATAGRESEVSQILCTKPQLAAYTGFNNSFSPLHRAAAAGHVEVCRCIIEPIKQRVKVAEAAVASGRKKHGTLKKWQALLATVLNQRTSRSMTPLMLACENGHAGVAAYLLREGADPLACDWVHMRTCLHYAAMGGQTDCLRLLCSANTHMVQRDGHRALRDVVVQDIQVESCRYIDQRAFGGLTPLHFAVVTGNLESVQALLRAGASIMVKTDGEAYIGDEYLVPGSTPLHIAVIIGNLSIIHAILQAHMENMNVVGQGLDERGRRPWEGSSRTDIRSVRNTFRKLPFHLARERGLQQLMSLVDPRIPIDVALDAARDTEHGIGPKRLSTIVSLVLQQSLLHWLDDCQIEMQKEATAHVPARTASSKRSVPDTAIVLPSPVQLSTQHSASQPSSLPASQPGSAPLSPALQRGGRPPRPPGANSRRNSGDYAEHAATSSAAPAAGPSGEGGCTPAERGSAASEGTTSSPKTPDAALATEAGAFGAAAGAAPAVELDLSAGAAAAQSALGVTIPGLTEDLPSSPFAQLALPPPDYDPTCPFTSYSAPVSPAVPITGLGEERRQRLPPVASVPGLLQLEEAQSGPAGSRTQESGVGHMRRMNSLHGYMGMLSVKRTRTRSVDVTSISAHFPNRAEPAQPLGQEEVLQLPETILPIHRQYSSPANITAGGSFTAGSAAGRGRPASELVEVGEAPDRTVTVLSKTRSIPGSTPMLRGMLSSIRGRLRSSESLPVPGPGSMEEGKDKDLPGDLEPSSPAKSEETEGDVECGVCLDHVVEVAFAGCEHSLCLECARNLTKQDKKPPHCPFCRRMVVGFMRVSPTRHPPLTRPHTR